MKSKQIVIIPAYNEEESIAFVVKRVQTAVPHATILVIDDGSHDQTALRARAAGAVVVELPANLGIGGAVQTGFLYAMENGYDCAFQVDGDGQHDPSEIPVILAPILAGQADVVVGSRYLEERGYITPVPRRIGIVMLANFIAALIRRPCTDPTSGFRAYNRRALELCANTYPQDYPEPEALVIFQRLGLRVQEVPVTMNPRYGGQSSLTPFRSGYYMVKVMLAILLSMFRKQPMLQQSL